MAWSLVLTVAKPVENGQMAGDTAIPIERMGMCSCLKSCFFPRVNPAHHAPRPAILVQTCENLFVSRLSNARPSEMDDEPE